MHGDRGGAPAGADEVLTPEALRRTGSGQVAPTRPGEATPARSSRGSIAKSPSKMRSRLRHCGRTLGFVPWLALASLVLLVGGLTIFAIKAKPAADAASALFATLGSPADTGFPLFMRAFGDSVWATVGVAGACLVALVVAAGVRLDQKLRKAGKYMHIKGPYGVFVFRFLTVLFWLGMVIMLLLALWSVLNGILLSSWAAQCWNLEKGATTAASSITSLDALGKQYAQALDSFADSVLAAAGGNATVAAAPAAAPAAPPATPARPPSTQPPATPPPMATPPPPSPVPSPAMPPPAVPSPPVQSPPVPSPAVPPPGGVTAATAGPAPDAPAPSPLSLPPVFSPPVLPAGKGEAPPSTTVPAGKAESPLNATVPAGNSTGVRMRRSLAAAGDDAATVGAVNATLTAGIASLKQYAANWTAATSSIAIMQSNGLCPSAACLNAALYPFTESTACVCTAAGAESLASLADRASKAAVWALVGVAGLFVGALLGCMEVAKDHVMLSSDQLLLKVIRRKSRRSSSRGSFKAEDVGPGYKTLSPNSASMVTPQSYSLIARTM